MTTYEQAIAQAAKPIAEAFFRIQEGTAREAAERAHTPGGPAVDELEDRITRWRDRWTETERQAAA